MNEDYIRRYNPEDVAFGPAQDLDPAEMEAISKHIDKYIPGETIVLHEIVSDLIHLDVFVKPASNDFPYQTLITCGMSQLPMSAPEDAQDFRYAELLIHLPASWPLDEKSKYNENFYWPIRLLKDMARFPHEFKTWLWHSHSIGNGEPSAPYADNTKFCGAVLIDPMLLDEGFESLKINDQKEVFFFMLVPLYEEEMTLKMNEGIIALVDQSERHGVSPEDLFVVNSKRKNIAASKRKFLFFK